MITQIIPSEVCLACKGCCRFSERNSAWVPTLTDQEVKTLLSGSIPPAFLSMDMKIRLITDHSGDNSFLCPCWNIRDDSCKIYEHRPLECQLYPLVLARSDGKFFLGADPQCPFVEQHMLEPDFQEYIAGVKEYLTAGEGAAVLNSNPHLFQKYNGIVTLAELPVKASVNNAKVQQPLRGSS